MEKVYIVFVLGVIGVVAILLGKNIRPKWFSKRGTTALFLIIMGFILGYGENPLIMYLLIGAGMFLTVIDIVNKSKDKRL